MRNDIFKVTGLDPKEGASVVFVWSHDRVSNELMLLGAGHTVGIDTVRPVGIETGQFAVTFLLPQNCTKEGIIVTGDKEGKQIIPRINLTACFLPNGTEPRIAFFGTTAASISVDAPPNHSQPMLACNTD